MKKLLCILVLLMPLAACAECVGTTCPTKLPGLRDYFASQALNAMDEESGLGGVADPTITYYTIAAYKYADAMMNARKMSPNQINQELRELRPQLAKK